MENLLLEIGDKLRCNNTLKFNKYYFKEDEMYEIIDILHYKIFKSSDVLFKGNDNKQQTLSSGYVPFYFDVKSFERKKKLKNIIKNI